jgi:glycosyltransferase involved in cell wall biosynthesis
MIPTFNREAWIDPCVASALSQRFQDLEVVIVDGASSDGTWQKCLDWARRDERVRIWRDPENQGPVAGWWRCIEEARGEFGTFLWSDDALQPDFVWMTIPWLEKAEIAFAYTAAEIGAEPGKGKIAYLRAGGPMSSAKFIDASLTSRGRFPVSPACALFRMNDLRKNFVRVVPTDPPLDLTSTGAGTDLLMMLGAARDRPLVAHVPRPLAFFRSHIGSISSRNEDGAVSRSYAITKAWFAKQNGRKNLVPRIIAWYWLGDMIKGRRLEHPTHAAHRFLDLASSSSMLLALTGVLAALVSDGFRSTLRTFAPVHKADSGRYPSGGS